MQDVYSYDMEQAKGHTGNNIVTVLMEAYDIGLQEASSRVGEVYAELMRAYLDARTCLRTRSSGNAPIDADIALYVKAMENWPIGNIVSLHTRSP